MQAIFSLGSRVRLAWAVTVLFVVLSGCDDNSAGKTDAVSTVARLKLVGQVGYLDIPAGGYPESGVLFVAHADGTGAEPLVLPQGTCCPRVSRDGTKMLGFTAAGGIEGATGRPATMNVDGSDYHEIPIQDATLNYIPQAWSPDGTRIAFEGWDDSHNSRNGIYTARTSDGGDIKRVTSVYGIHDIPADYSPDGKYILFYREVTPLEGEWDRNGSLWIVPAVGGKARKIETQGIRPHPSARWSPDGTTILFSNARASSFSNLWTVNVDGSHLKKLFEGTEGRYPYFPEWSPDGSKIMFSLMTLGDYYTHPTSSVYVINADGSNPTKVIGDQHYKALFGWWQ